MKPEITIIHPTRNRPSIALETAKKWANMADNWCSIEYILSTDEDDISDYNIFMDMGWHNGIGTINKNNSAIEAINVAAKISKGRILIIISDDFDCPEHWDTLLLEALSDKSDFVAKTHDGIQKTLVTLPIMDRLFYERFGYVYHPGFSHMGADVELTAVAMMLGKYINIPLQFSHLHYTRGLSSKDAINEKNDLTYAHGDTVLKEHLKDNFGIQNPLIQYNEIVWH